MPLMMRVAFDHRKLSPKWSIQGPLAGMMFPFKAAFKADDARQNANGGGRCPPPSGPSSIVELIRFRLDVRVLDDLRVTRELDQHVVVPFLGLRGERLHALGIELRHDVGGRD